MTDPGWWRNHIGKCALFRFTDEAEEQVLREYELVRVSDGCNLKLRVPGELGGFWVTAKSVHYCEVLP